MATKKTVKAKPSKLKNFVVEAARLARDIAKFEAKKAKKKAISSVKKAANKQVRSVKKQALDFIGIKPKRKTTKKAGAK